MTPNEFFAQSRTVETPSGLISYVERGGGAVALFVHGVLLNNWLWRHQIEGLSSQRRCIAPDLLAHGKTEISDTQDVSVTANARMLKQLLDALNIQQVDLVGNDSGGGICQIFAALYPERIRSLTLTNCDTHDNWPPVAFTPFVEMVATGGLAGTLAAMLDNKDIYRSQEALGPAYERPTAVTDETIDAYLKPHVLSEKRTRDLERFVLAFDNAHTVSIEKQLRALTAPALVVWGNDDVYFGVNWAMWLGDALAGARQVLILKGARIFFPEERPAEFNQALGAFWATLPLPTS